jgi:hypothetical protein
MPPHNGLTLWVYPNFTPLDVRFVVWLMTYRFKARKRAELQAGMEPAGSNSTHTLFTKPSFGYASESIASASSAQPNQNPITTNSSESESTVLVPHPDETGFHGLGTGLSVGPTPPEDFQLEQRNRSKKAAVSTMLEGFVDRVAACFLPEITNRARYYDIVRRAVGVALVGRASLGALAVFWAWRRWRNVSGGRG